MSTAESGAPTKRSVIIGIGMASALVPLNSTMVAVALPKVARAFDIGRGRAGVLVTVYLVAMLIGQPLAGRVCDRVGDKRTTVTSLLGFAVFSAAASVAPSFVWLVVARGLQAVFAAALAPSVQSMLRAVRHGPSRRPPRRPIGPTTSRGHGARDGRRRDLRTRALRS